MLPRPSGAFVRALGACLRRLHVAEISMRTLHPVHSDVSGLSLLKAKPLRLPPVPSVHLAD
jgi:hypothetical protein